jgi:diacylglycerol kinase family enzyme
MLDGRDLSGDFLMLEVMNTRSIGPNLVLAPEAVRGDGLLDVVLVPTVERDQLIEYLRDQPQKGQNNPALAVHRGRRLQIKGREGEFHLDDRPWPDQDKRPTDHPFLIEVDVKHKALHFLVRADHSP